MSTQEDIAFNQAQLKNAAQALREVITASEAGGVASLDALGITIVNRLRIMLSHPGPSLPGEPPGFRTGRLRNSYAYRIGTSPLPYVDVGSDARSDDGFPYPVALEFGTSRMAARPHLRVAIAQTVEDVPRIVARAISSAQSAALKGGHSQSTGLLHQVADTIEESLE